MQIRVVKMNDHAMPARSSRQKSEQKVVVESKVTMLLRRCRQVWFYNAKKDGKIGGHRKIKQPKETTVHIRLRLVRTLTISCGALRANQQSASRGHEKRKGGGETYFLFLFEPPGSSTSIPSSSFRPAPAAARLLAFCFSRRRSATSLSTTFRASSC
jgi:hypothetical protein